MCRELGYRHPNEMLGDLTHEEWCDWLNYFRQDPWDETRKDNRMAVAAIWSVKHYLEADTEVPGFEGPAYSSGKEEDTGESWKRLQAAKTKFLNGQLNRKTGDPPNG